MGFSEHMKKASLVGAFFVSVLWHVQALAFCPAPGRLAPVEVARVVDGDTLRLVDGRSVRLIGIDTPELGRKGRKPEAFAVAAQRRLQVLVQASEGRVGLVTGAEAKDRYGRTLAHAYDARGRNLEATLLAEGLGFMVAVAPNTALVACHQRAEQQARHDRLGIWRKLAPRSPQSLRRGGFTLLEGKVERVERNRGGYWLEMDGPLVVHIPPSAFDTFDLRVLTALAGKRLELRGWVVDRRGRVAAGQARWMLRVTHPAMLGLPL
ncbi:thermonuclease family protein [Stutzerimonas stutzeri]|uniref:Nuclease n=1 Tax=Stutzerimonas stutzeri TaxID=316 RepID=A0A2N8RE35_STUST|nr:thermonuclease family protein [Stutzerimonas stutzeri]EHY78208.1 nuclease [Stutzerimonas stutzeri ATCC 14405 = CCUG 16156]MCQ4254970.1 thermonuclease family protein [Stutzerimonas stutzeri]PNF59335.1 nuclease [Stutzerimonas stutzeri]QOZ97236.1 thermonuclease family protein [Stutzerimonas stutzeri]